MVLFGTGAVLSGQSREIWQGETVITWTVGESVFRAMPEAGARLMSWDIAVAGKPGERRVIVPWAQLDRAEEVPLARGGNPVLFPFAGRTYASGRPMRWQGPDGVEREMPIHGFARQARFEIVEMDSHGFTARLKSDARWCLYYPGEYSFEVQYRFRQRGLDATLRLRAGVTNALPWAPGFHTYFAIPRNTLERDAWWVQLSPRAVFRRGTTGELVLTDVPTFPQPLLRGALRDRFFCGLSGAELRFGPQTGAGVRLSLYQPEGENPVPAAHSGAVLFWSESDDADYMCVEPWSAPGNAWETKTGLRWVKAGGEDWFQVKITAEQDAP